MKSRVVGRRLGEIGSTEAKVKILLAVSGGSRGDVLLERTADYIHFRGLSGGPLGEKRGSLCPAGPIFQGKLVEKPCTVDKRADDFPRREKVHESVEAAKYSS
uniref:Uncharacterized protein n=1 Tax=Vespula pensylvanica TaxID=30213 RepID=A0A834UGH0_VESPE|nr:hypothetical protein H0235_000846 [Vespula pensylvanica]